MAQLTLIPHTWSILCMLILCQCVEMNNSLARRSVMFTLSDGDMGANFLWLGAGYVEQTFLYMYAGVNSEVFMLIPISYHSAIE